MASTTFEGPVTSRQGFVGGVTATAATATETEAGLVMQSALVAEAAGASPTAAEFKALLDALKAAGIMASA